MATAVINRALVDRFTAPDVVWRLTSLGWAAIFALSLPVSGLLAYRYREPWKLA